MTTLKIWEEKVKIVKNIQEYFDAPDKTINYVTQKFLEEKNMTHEDYFYCNFDCTNCFNILGCANCVNCCYLDSCINSINQDSEDLQEALKGNSLITQN